MIVFLRHAERGDNQLPVQLSEIAHDPPIIKASKKTIETTSQQLAQLFRQQGIQKFKIISSKFLRCLMTAQGVEKKLVSNGFKMEPQYYETDNRISEYLREDWFSEFPLNDLILNTEHIKKYTAPQLKLKDCSPSLKMNYPENYVKFHKRVTDFKNSLKFPDAGTCVLIFTHGFVVRQLCFHMNQLPRYQNEIKYCGYAAFKHEKNTDILLKSKL